MSKARNSSRDLGVTVALKDCEGVRSVHERIDGVAVGAPPPDPEVADKPVRRRFTAEYKLGILAEAHAARSPGEIGAMLRREASRRPTSLKPSAARRRTSVWCCGPSRRGVAAIQMQSRRPKSAAKLLDQTKCEQLRAILHESPRQFGKDRSTWTLELAAEVCVERGLTEQKVTIETIRDAIHRLGMGWKRAKDWITSPDPAYARKKSGAIGS